MNNEKYLYSKSCTIPRAHEGENETHRKNVWVVGNAQFRWTSSVVVTLVQVIHNETSCPARRDNTKRFVQILEKRLPRLAKNASGDE